LPLKRNKANKTIDFLIAFEDFFVFKVTGVYPLTMEQSKKKIFLVDDDTSFLEETKKMLEEGGYEVAVCNRPAESIFHIRKYKPDCVILDLRMPNFEGQALLPWIRCQFPDLTIVVCTGTTHYDKTEFPKFNVEHLIEKPFTNELFFNTIEAAIQGNRTKRAA
jgi:DNA-binding NtrC family response regulator